MPEFAYSARRPSGEPVSGERWAASADALRQTLAAEGIFLTDARPVRRGLFADRGGRRVRLNALLAFVREYRSLTRAALPVTKVLALLENRKDDPALAAAIRGVRAEVEKGKSLADAMTSFPNAFGPLVQATFRVGAETGNMQDALARLEAFLILRHQLQRNIRKAMSYPIFLLGLLVLVMAGLMLFVLPRFATLYSEFDSELPLPTRILMASVDAAPVWVPALAVGGAVLWLLARAILAAGPARLARDWLVLRLPGFGPVLLNMALIQISHMMALLLHSGMTLPEALGHTAAALSNRHAGTVLARTRHDVTQGKPLSAALAQHRLLPPTALSLLEAGEASGEVETMFTTISAMQEQELDERMGRLLALIEPAMMMLVGIVLGTVIIAVYLPIFGLSSVVR